MKNISVIFAICLVPLLGFGIYLVVQNRNLEALRSKALPALAIAVMGVLFTIWFSLKSENIGLQFVSTLFFHKSDKKPLDELYKDQYDFGGDQFDIGLLNFIDKYIEQNQELNKAVFDNGGDEKITQFYHDMVFIKLLSRFFWMYADWWDININSVRRGNSLSSETQAVKPISASSSLEWKNFLGALDANDNLYKLLSSFSEDFHIKKMTVPPKTKVNFITSEYRRVIILENPFVKVSITIDKSGGSIGLGDYKWLLGYDNKKSEEFWSEHFKINCKAEFEKFRSGHPEMPKYKKWVETMFAEIQYQLDEEKRLKRALDYHGLKQPKLNQGN
ncbi:MAG: hypothetical protein WCE45_05135 [Sedimentisphaerales bacterium]